ncbi:hypothetical protein ACJMK2_000676 [Sinanodonta woodiana]|uniref:Transposable element P transposase-like RNase H domain-containing protein n=1 Tax=Sinanodonta woodiana TaxID=1069815 RepID=A0ABD3XQ68_SINWO
MYNSAQKLNLPPSGFFGDLVLNMKCNENKLIGWIDTGKEAEALRILKEKEVKQTLASKVLQVSFLGYTGFRFPIAHYPTAGVKASELYIIIWDIISNLQSWGFTVNYILQDGGDQNREFMKIHFTNDADAKMKNYMSANLANPVRKIAHSQDFSHNVKKLRNAVLSSGIQSFHTMKMVKCDKCIVWDQWIHAAKWDEDTNSRKIHYKLSYSHLHPDSSEKMRNHLAEDVLNQT